MAAKAGQPLVLVLPFQVNAGPDMPDASRDVPQLIVSQLEQNGLKAVPMNRARALFERSGDNSIDLATAAALGAKPAPNWSFTAASINWATASPWTPAWCPWSRAKPCPPVLSAIPWWL